jgi:hypothetical protein
MIDVASRAPHGRKHGATFAETWKTRDGTAFVAVGSVVAGADPIVVSDLLRVAAKTVINSAQRLDAGLAGLARLIAAHARDHKDPALAADVVLAAVEPDGKTLHLAGAERLTTVLVDGGGARQQHGPRLTLRRGDRLIVATVPLPGTWWSHGARTADSLVRLGDATELSAAVVSNG